MDYTETTRLKCPRCEHEWPYSGGSKFYASCSYCRTSVNIQKNMIQSGNPLASKNQIESAMKNLAFKG